MNDTEYAMEWYKYGLKQKDDAIIKFMMHWIAFNWLYSECREGTDDANIRAFCYRNSEKLSRYDPFVTDAFDTFKTSPVRDEARGTTNTNRYHSLLDDRGVKRDIALLLTIYQVRCNLFHGSKSLHNERDIQLVHDASVILEGYLSAVLL